MAGRQRPTTLYAYVGCFTSPKRGGTGDGIGVYRVKAETGGWRAVQKVAPLVNPSWLLSNRAGSVLYALHADGDHARAFAIDGESGRLSPMGTAKTGGINGVSAKLDGSEKFLVVANYGSGHVSVLPVRKDGALGDAIQSIALPGEPRLRHRVGHQECAHPHDIVFDPTGRFVIVPDKGLDRIFVFRFNARTGQLTPAGKGGFIDSRDGAGPRHVAFHPGRAVVWVLNELDSTLTTCRWDGKTGVLSPIDVVMTVPGDFTGDNQTSEIEFVASTNTLYISNRGHDSLTLFRVNRTTGLPKLIGWQKTGGKGPRFFGFDPSGRFLYAAHLRSHTIKRFAVDARSGALTAAGQAVATPSPCAIEFVEGGP